MVAGTSTIRRQGIIQIVGGKFAVRALLARRRFLKLDLSQSERGWSLAIVWISWAIRNEGSSVVGADPFRAMKLVGFTSNQTVGRATKDSSLAKDYCAPSWGSLNACSAKS